MVDLNSVSTELVFTSGSATNILIYLMDDNDDVEALGGYDKAAMSFREEAGGAAVLTRTTEDGADPLVIEQVDGDWVVNCPAPADAVTPGLYVADVILHHLTNDEWQYSTSFYVRVLPAITEIPV